MSKKIFIFLHAAKSGGSSFWHSLVDSLSGEGQRNKNRILDLMHFARKNYNGASFVEQQMTFLTNIESFYKSRQNNLIIHYHAKSEGLDDIFDDLKPKYILLIRNAEKRLISAYKWFLIKKCKGANFDKKLFLIFKNTFLSYGYQKLIPDVFNLPHSSTAFNCDQADRILPISLNEYNNFSDSDSLKKLLFDLDAKNFKPIINSETLSDKQKFKAELPGKNDKTFWNNIKEISDNEDSFNKFLFAIKKSNF